MKIICLHQSADLYGSDRSFLQVLTYLKASGKFDLITVILPRKGPLVTELSKIGVEVKFMQLSLLSKTYLKKLQFGKILFPLLGLGKKINLVKQYDILYVNTSVILDFYVMAPFIKIKKIIHVREIPVAWMAKLLSSLLRISGAKVIFNSIATQKSFNPAINSVVIHNAFEGFKIEENLIEPAALDSRLKILLIGRISEWKGQDFAVQALAKLKNRSFTLRIVGDTSKGNEDVLVKLRDEVNSLGLANNVEFIDFMHNTQDAYIWSDVVIVPSKKPEPFCRIDIEAMILGKPVIAAAHGGLTEIVYHGRSGFLFKPNDPDSLNECISNYLNDRDLLIQHGKNAESAFNKSFSIKRFYNELDIVFGNHGIDKAINLNQQTKQAS